MAMSVQKLAGLVVGGVLVLGAIYTLLFLKPENVAPPKKEVVRPARVFTVPDPGAQVVRRFPGVVRGANRVPLSFRVGGTLTELFAHEASELEKGAVVAKLDPRDYESQVLSIEGQITSAKAILDAMETGERDEVIRMLEAKVKAATASRDSAATEYGRQARLFEKSLISKSQLDRYKLKIDTEQEMLVAAEEELAKARAGARQEELDAQRAQIEALEAQLKKAQDALRDTVLKAPFTGVITKRYVDNFEEVTAGMPIVQLQAFDLLEAVADLPEALIATIETEMIEQMTVSFAFNEGVEYTAKLHEVTAEADPRTSTYRVTVWFDQPEDVRILPGMTSTLTLVINQAFGQSLRGRFIPADAVFTDEGGAQNVWVVDPETRRVARRPVTVGEIHEGRISIQQGLSTGDLVVTAGVHMLTPNQQVRPVEQASN